MKRSLIFDIIRSFFFFIDRAIYELTRISYELFHQLSGLSILGESSFEKFTSRVYLLLGIFALFKIAFALIGMFVNPDSFSDSKNGGGKLIKKVIVVLLLITFVPTIFKLGFTLQGIILDNNVLPTIILGSSSNPERSREVYENGGRMISSTVFKSFFRPTSDSQGNYNFTGCPDCKDIYEKEDSDISDFSSVLNEVNEDGKYVFDYNIFVSTIAGLATAFLLITFAFDVAIRSVKLTFLQLIAPIPIIMSVDPKKGEDGLKKWISNTTSTYLDLFMRLIIIYFVVYLLAELTRNGGNSITLFRYTSSGDLIQAEDINAFATVFIIFGLLLFAKQAPNLIYDLLGIKPPSGGFGLNPMKKLSSIPLLGGVAAAGAYAGFGLAKSGLKYGGSTVKSLGQRVSGNQEGAASTLRNANARLANRVKLVGQEASGRVSANKFGGNDKYSGTTLSGTEKKERLDNKNKILELNKADRERERLQKIGASIVGAKGEKTINYKDRDGNVQSSTYGDFKKINNSEDMFRAFNQVYTKQDYAASMVNITHTESELSDAKVSLQQAISRMQENPNDEQVIKQFREASGSVEKTEGMLKGFKENHEKLQAKHKDMAEIEKSIKSLKQVKSGQNVSFDASKKN